MNKKKNKIDDGFNAELVKTAMFDGLLEIPTIKKPSEFIIPRGTIPFSHRHNSKDFSEFIHFHEHDIKFESILTCTKELLPEIKKFAGVISPDCSLYYDMPLVLQMTNTYLNRQIGHYLQTKGVYVIPNIRWGDERSYTRLIPTERPFAFLGVEKHSIVSIGTYGCCKTKEEKYHIREGLRAMLKELEPKIVLVYGSMPKSIFGEFEELTQFIQFDDWTTEKHKRGK